MVGLVINCKSGGLAGWFVKWRGGFLKHFDSFLENSVNYWCVSVVHETVANSPYLSF